MVSRGVGFIIGHSGGADCGMQVSSCYRQAHSSDVLERGGVIWQVAQNQ